MLDPIHIIPGRAQVFQSGRDPDYLNGHIVRRGKALGSETPAKQVRWAMMKLIKAKAS